MPFLLLRKPGHHRDRILGDPKFLSSPFSLVAVEGIPDLILNHGVLDAVNGDIGLECLEFFGRKIGEKLVFGLAVGG